MLNKENLALLAEYNEHEIKKLIREAFKGSLQIYTIDNENNFFPVPIVKLQEIYTNHPNKVEIIFRLSIRNNYQIQNFGSWRYIGMNDLVLDKTIANNVIKISSQNEELKTEKLFEDTPEETAKNRDARLIQRAAQLVNANKKATIKSIQEQLLKEESNKSRVQMPTLRKIITKKSIKSVLSQECEKAIP